MQQKPVIIDNLISHAESRPRFYPGPKTGNLDSVIKMNCSCCGLARKHDDALRTLRKPAIIPSTHRCRFIEQSHIMLQLACYPTKFRQKCAIYTLINGMDTCSAGEVRRSSDSCCGEGYAGSKAGLADAGGCCGASQEEERPAHHSGTIATRDCG